MKVYSENFTFDIDEKEAQKTLSKNIFNKLKGACDKVMTIYYVKKDKKINPTEDAIAYFNPKMRGYVLIPVTDVVKVLPAFSESEILKEVNKILEAEANGVKPAKVKDAKKVDTVTKLKAIMNIGCKRLAKAFPIKSMAIILDFNFWIDFAYKKLNIKAPKSEDVLNDRYLKTLKIYAMAFQAGRNLPVPVLRTLLKSMDYTTPVITEIIDQTDVNRNLMNTTVKTMNSEKSNRTLVEQDDNLTEVKWHGAYPVSQYRPTTLLIGTQMTEKAKKSGKVIQSITSEPVIDRGNTAFVVKKMWRNVSFKGKNKEMVITKSKQDCLVFYVPMPQSKKIYAAATTEDLTDVAYKMAVSLAYPLVRIDFR